MRLTGRIVMLVGATLLAIAISQVSDQEVVITYDEGGDVNKYLNVATQWKHNDISVKIDGECYSACTIFINDQFKENTCITENARFGFHLPFVTNIETGDIVHDIPDYIKFQLQMYRDYFWSSYNQKIRDHLTKNGWPDVYEGADREDVTFMEYDDMKDIVDTCD